MPRVTRLRDATRQSMHQPKPTERQDITMPRPGPCRKQCHRPARCTAFCLDGELLLQLYRLCTTALVCPPFAHQQQGDTPLLLPRVALSSGRQAQAEQRPVAGGHMLEHVVRDELQLSAMRYIQNSRPYSRVASCTSGCSDWGSAVPGLACMQPGSNHLVRGPQAPVCVHPCVLQKAAAALSRRCGRADVPCLLRVSAWCAPHAWPWPAQQTTPQARAPTRPGRAASSHPAALQLAHGDPAFGQLASPQQRPSTALRCRLGHIRPAGLFKALRGPALRGRVCSGSCRGSGPGVAGSGAGGNPGGAAGAEGRVGGSKVGVPLARPWVCRQDGCGRGIGPCRGSCGVRGAGAPVRGKVQRVCVCVCVCVWGGGCHRLLCSALGWDVRECGLWCLSA